MAATIGPGTLDLVCYRGSTFVLSIGLFTSLTGGPPYTATDMTGWTGRMRAFDRLTCVNVFPIEYFAGVVLATMTVDYTTVAAGYMTFGLTPTASALLPDRICLHVVEFINPAGDVVPYAAGDFDARGGAF